MKKLFVVTFMAGFIAAPAAYAGQSNMPAGKGQQPKAADTAGMKPSTITGCVARSGSVYRLDNAMVAVDTDVDTQNRPGTEANPTPKMMSYILAGADVKAHVGHKVEVTGTTSTSKTSKETAGVKEAAGITLAGTLNVRSVKMVSATCP